jgi:hypothetical protein
MDESAQESRSNLADGGEPDERKPEDDKIAMLRIDFESRLITANLRTEAVRAGMIDLDGLKLIDLSKIHLDENDKVVGDREIMADLRRNKPWLFGVASTSSAATAPASQPVRQKTAMDMTEAEYTAEGLCLPVNKDKSRVGAEVHPVLHLLRCHRPPPEMLSQNTDPDSSSFPTTT